MNPVQRPPWWLWPNLLALDAPIVALLWQDLFSRCFETPLHWRGRFLLGAASWLVYATDYLLDGRRSATVVPRHAFFRRWQKWMSVAVFVALVSCAATAFGIRRNLFSAGVWCGVAVLLYLGAAHIAPPRWRTLWPRELGVAAIFVAATALSSITSAAIERVFLIPPSILLTLLCWLNVALIESREALFWQTARPSRSGEWITRHVQAVSSTLIGTCAVLAVMALVPIEFLIAAALSSLGLLMLDRRRDLSPNAFRVAADAVLCTPALVILLHTL